jgi:hypothetical protein
VVGVKAEVVAAAKAAEVLKEVVAKVVVQLLAVVAKAMGAAGLAAPGTRQAEDAVMRQKAEARSNKFRCVFANLSVERDALPIGSTPLTFTLNDSLSQDATAATGRSESDKFTACNSAKAEQPSQHLGRVGYRSSFNSCDLLFGGFGPFLTGSSNGRPHRSCSG